MTQLTPEPPVRRKRLSIRRGAPKLTVLDAQGSAPFTDHLEELRRRLISLMVLLIVVFSVAYYFSGHLFDLLNAPLGNDFRVQTLSVTEPFFTTITVAAQAAALVIVPAACWHVWAFVRPAMRPEWRRTAAWVLGLTPVLFTIGMVFGYFFVLGPAVRFLLGMGRGKFDVAVRAQEYYSFTSMTLLGMGLVFCFPLLLAGAGRIGIITAKQLRQNRRIAFVLMAVLAALLPTADPVSLIIETVPLLFLFELSIWFVALQERMAARAEQ